MRTFIAKPLPRAVEVAARAAQASVLIARRIPRAVLQEVREAPEHRRHATIQVDRLEPRKIDAHGLSSAEVEGSFDNVFTLQRRGDGSFKMYAVAPSGRRI